MLAIFRELLLQVFSSHSPWKLSILGLLGFPGLALQAPLFGTPLPSEETPLEDLVNIELENDVRVFAVMAALNAAGFDTEAEGREWSPVRLRLREELADLDPILLAELRRFHLDRVRDLPEHEQQALYTSLALLLGGPPEFALDVEPEKMPGDTDRLRGFQELVRQVFQEPLVEALWEESEPLYREELDSYRPVFKEVVQDTLDYFRIPARVALDRRIILTIDLLSPHNVVNARSLGGDYFIVVGPVASALDNLVQLQHAYLHFLIDPLVEKYTDQLRPHFNLLEVAHAQPNLRPEFEGDQFLLVFTESLIESIRIRTLPPDNPDRELIRLFREGLILTPLLLEELKRFESSDLLSFPAFFETMMRELSKDRVEAGRRRIASLEKKFEQEEKERLETDERAREEFDSRERIRSLLSEAQRMLSANQMEAAETALQQVLVKEPEHPSALFYLAQVASQSQEHEKAFEYYRKVARIDSAPLPARAWSLVRMGRFRAFQGREEEARAYLEEVLELAGDLQGAREEAERSLQMLAHDERH